MPVPSMTTVSHKENDTAMSQTLKAGNRGSSMQRGSREFIIKAKAQKKILGMAKPHMLS